MKEITAYRLSITGSWGYEFYDAERNRIGSVRAEVLPSAPVLIRNETVDWYSKYDMERTLVSVTSRWVTDNRTGREVYRIVLLNHGIYRVITADGRSVQVEIRDDAYLFGKPQEPVIAVTKRIEKADWLPESGFDVKPYSKTLFYVDVSPQYMMMVLSFPALRFY